MAAGFDIRGARTDPTQAGGGDAAARHSAQDSARGRVLQVAHELFDSQGYQGTTIREIASRAGISVGGVFTRFASKAEILSQVMAERLDGLYAELDRVAPNLRGSTADRLRSIFAIHFAFEAKRLRLFLSHIAAAYDWTQTPDARPYGRNERLVGIVRDCLAKGVELGDVDSSTCLDDVVDLILGAYAWTYRLVVTEGAGAQTMTAVMDRQIGLIADGFRPRG